MPKYPEIGDFRGLRQHCMVSIAKQHPMVPPIYVCDLDKGGPTCPKKHHSNFVCVCDMNL